MEINRYIEKIKRDYREYIEEDEIEQECQLIYLEKKKAGYGDRAVYKAIKERMEYLKNDNMQLFYVPIPSLNLGVVGLNGFLNAEKTPSYSLGA